MPESLTRLPSPALCSADDGRGRGSARRSGEALRRLLRRRGHQPADAAGRVLLVARSVGLRQDHDAPHDRRVRAADRGADPLGRRRHGADPAAQAQRQHGVPELRVVPPPDGGGERGVRPSVQEGVQAGDDGAGRSRARARAAHRVLETAADAALGRPAAARRPRARPDPEPRRAPAGRAARRARRQAPQAAADRAEGVAGGGRHHVHLRDARPGRSPHDVRPDRGDVAGPGRAGGPAAGDLRGAAHRVRGGLPRCLKPDGGGGAGGRAPGAVA